MFDPVEPGSFRTREPRHRRGRPQQPADPYVRPRQWWLESLEEREADGLDVMTVFLLGMVIGALFVAVIFLLAIAGS